MALIATDKPRVIVGLGVTGLSCARYLRKQGVPFAIADSREAPPNIAALRAEMPEVAVHLGAFDAELFKLAGELIVSPGIALEEPAIAAAKNAGVAICGDIDLFVRANAQSPKPAPIVAITGSNGKSTVTTLVGDMAAAAGKHVGVGGNLGTAALDLLDDAADLYVLELSSFQLERAQPLEPLVATVLNISPDHQDRHPTLVSYHQAKHRIFRGAQQAVVNRADPLSRPLVPDSAPKWSFGLDAPDFKGFGLREHTDAAGRIEKYLAFERELLMPVRELKIVGNHNIANALAALALGHAAGLPMSAMLQTLRAFTGLPHRCQLVAAKDEVRFFNDSKGTNVGATIAAIEGLCNSAEDRIVLIAGGVGKGAEFHALAPVLQRCGRGVVLIGEAADEIAAAVGASVPQVRADSMTAAVAAAAAMAHAGDSVLLSPACASFDMFNNYAHRGDMFVAAVNALVGVNS